MNDNFTFNEVPLSTKGKLIIEIIDNGIGMT